MSTVLETFNEIFKDVEFDKNLYKLILHSNIKLITKNENKNFFGGQLIGCYVVKYTYYDKDEFFSYVFDKDSEEIEKKLKTISTLNQSFKISFDSINLTCFYIAHRFLTNNKLSKKEQLEYAAEILNYFNYRTLLVICSNYFIYPISEEEALSLFERLSNRYIIKKVKNWNEYCQYRSNEYLESKQIVLLKSFRNDDELPNAINDLFIRTKDTLKNIYREFIKLQEDDNSIGIRKSTLNDLEGKEVIVDNLHSAEKYSNILVSSLSDKNNFIRSDYVNVTLSIIKNISYKHINECLELFYEYSHKDSKTFNETQQLLTSIIINTLSYIQKHNLHVKEGASIIKILNMITGVLLYSRKTNVEINTLKQQLSNHIDKIYKVSTKKKLSSKVKPNLRNAFYVYVLIRTFAD